MRRFVCTVVLVAVMTVGANLPGRAAQIDFWGDLTTAVQTLDAQSPDRDTPRGFTAARSNLHLASSLSPDLYTYAEVHFKSADTVSLNQFYFALNDVFRGVSVKAGRLELEYGMPLYYRTDNAEVGQNIFVGNTLVDPFAVQDGVEATYRAGKYYLRGALTTGTDTAGFTTNRSFGKTLRFFHQPRESISWSFSYYAADESLSPENTNFLVEPAGEAYTGLTTGDTTVTNVTSPGSGNDFESFQLDVRYHPEPDWTIGTFFGRLEDDSTTQNALNYLNLRLAKSLDQTTRVGAQIGMARYSEVNSSDPGADGVRRFQFVVSKKFKEQTTLKLEYVRQTVDDGLGSVLTTRRPVEFDGFIAQLHVGF